MNSGCFSCFGPFFCGVMRGIWLRFSGHKGVDLKEAVAALSEPLQHEVAKRFEDRQQSEPLDVPKPELEDVDGARSDDRRMQGLVTAEAGTQDFEAEPMTTDEAARPTVLDLETDHSKTPEADEPNKHDLEDFHAEERGFEADEPRSFEANEAERMSSEAFEARTLTQDETKIQDFDAGSSPKRHEADQARFVKISEGQDEEFPADKDEMQSRVAGDEEISRPQQQSSTADNLEASDPGLRFFFLITSFPWSSSPQLMVGYTRPVGNFGGKNDSLPGAEGVPCFC